MIGLFNTDPMKISMDRKIGTSKEYMIQKQTPLNGPYPLYPYTFILNIYYLSFTGVMIIFCSSCGLIAVWLPYTSISAILYVIFFLVGISINVLGAATVDLYPTQLR